MDRIKRSLSAAAVSVLFSIPSLAGPINKVYDFAKDRTFQKELGLEAYERMSISAFDDGPLDDMATTILWPVSNSNKAESYLARISPSDGVVLLSLSVDKCVNPTGVESSLLLVDNQAVKTFYFCEYNDSLGLLKHYVPATDTAGAYLVSIFRRKDIVWVDFQVKGRPTIPFSAAGFSKVYKLISSAK